jgi:hypothetical protein
LLNEVYVQTHNVPASLRAITRKLAN